MHVPQVCGAAPLQRGGLLPGALWLGLDVVGAISVPSAHSEGREKHFEEVI